MIYTACGKDKSGAFSVWAKSANVTKAECDEIVKLMSYRKPQNVPYEPTEEEIRTLFPKKYGYFILSSGRICLAQTNYIGKVYSDLDARNGNFIIHAYIADRLDGFNPFSIINSDLFKTSLSYQEWHDSEAPSDLPQVELSVEPSVDEALIRKYLLGSQRGEVASFLQAVIDAATNGGTVTFNDTEEKQAQLYSLLGILLPSGLFEKITFSNQYSTQLDFAMSGTSTKPLVLRNIFSSMVNSTYNYQAQLDAGQLVFYFEKGICSNVKPKRYLSDIIASIEGGDKIFAVLKKIDAVNKIALETGCNIDKAIAVYYLTQLKLDWFSGLDEYSQALTVALEHKYVDESAVASRVYNDIIKSARWGRGTEILPLMKFAYRYSDDAVKTSIMDEYFGNLTTYGVNVNAQPNAVLTQVKNNAPFPWDDFAASVVGDQKWEKYMNKYSSVSYLYFVFDAVICAIMKNAGGQVAYNILIFIIKKSIDRKNFDEVQLYLSAASKLGRDSLSWLIDSSLLDLLNGTIKDEATLDFVFRLACAAQSDKQKTELIAKLVVRNMQSAFFMRTYVKYSEQFPAVFAQVENAYKNENAFKDFLFKKEAYVFRTTSKVTWRMLDEYFNKFYRAGHDSGVYKEKVGQYLDSFRGKDKLAESLRVYDQIKGLPDNFRDVLQILYLIDCEIFNLSVDELLSFAVPYMRSIDELNGRLQKSRFKLPDNYNMLYTVLVIRGKLGGDYCADQVQRNLLYVRLDEAQLSRFIKNYFGDALQLYCAFRKKKFDGNILLRAVFERPVYNIRGSIELISGPIEKLGSKEYYEVMSDIFAYAFNKNDKFATELIIFAQRYAESLNKSDYKKLFNKIVEIMPKEDVPAVQAYIDEFLKNHKGFFEKLFNKKK